MLPQKGKLASSLLESVGSSPGGQSSTYRRNLPASVLCSDLLRSSELSPDCRWGKQLVGESPASELHCPEAITSTYIPLARIRHMWLQGGLENVGPRAYSVGGWPASCLCCKNCVYLQLEKERFTELN